MNSSRELSGEAAVWERFAGALEGFVRNRVSDSHAAEDVLQDIYLKLHDRAGSLRDEDKVTGWVFTIARNSVIDYYRARARDREQPVGQPRARATVLSPEDIVTAPGQTWNALAECLPPLLNELSEKHREAIELVELGGLSRREAADRVGISESGMKSRVQRARAHMAQTLHGWCDLVLDSQGTPVNCLPHDKVNDPG